MCKNIFPSLPGTTLYKAQFSLAKMCLECVNNWSEALDKKNKVDIIYLDISRAFDTVSHPKLLYKLRNIGINGNLYHWCDDTSGVPQGTIIGPIAFL